MARLRPFTAHNGRSGERKLRLYPYEFNIDGPKAVKILRWTKQTTGRNSRFYAERRRPVGFDSGLSDNANVLNGFVFPRAEEFSGNSRRSGALHE